MNRTFRFFCPSLRVKVFETLQEVFDLCVIERIDMIHKYFGNRLPYGQSRRYM